MSRPRPQPALTWMAVLVLVLTIVGWAVVFVSMDWGWLLHG